MTVPSSRPTAVRLGAAVLAVVVVLLVPAGPAWAHNTLRSAAPAQESTLSSAPTEIVLEFVERLDPTFTTIVLTDAAKRKVPTGDPVVGGAKGSVQVTEALPNGSYTVAYRVVSTDGHPVQGSYPFTVADPNSSAAPIVGPTTDAPSAAASVQDDDGPGAGVLVAGGATAIVVAVVGGLFLRRRANRR
ncbi:copper resistance CopC family protein [Micromonospora antibiotica]|uniref:Copper resistance protein CopC n=1 Tax=Micromonospora antibiotica TaxID=2807623 RepID=A0ABS3V6Q3_9ACTN|nr:copper resistance CopC family protein [Micromonospora antibiotica]MBO4161289.1 copper resistance protein CopC [Micromonospora antibiotica]